MGGAPIGAMPGAAPGQSPWGPLASWGERVVAVLIDGLIIFVLFFAVFIAATILSKIASALGAIVFVLGYLGIFAVGLYLGYLNGSIGQTPGKKVMGLRVVSEQTGQLIGGGAGIGRAFLHILDSLPCYIGYLFPLWDAKRQTFSDKVMKTVVTNNNPKVPFVDAAKSLLPTK